MNPTDNWPAYDAQCDKCGVIFKAMIHPEVFAQTQIPDRTQRDSLLGGALELCKRMVQRAHCNRCADIENNKRRAVAWLKAIAAVALKARDTGQPLSEKQEALLFKNTAKAFKRLIEALRKEHGSMANIGEREFCDLFWSNAGGAVLLVEGVKRFLHRTGDPAQDLKNIHAFIQRGAQWIAQKEQAA